MKIDDRHFVAGHGIYVSENPHSSSQFIRGTGEGSLIEVVVKQGTKFIDLPDKDVLAELAAKRITANDVYKLNPNVSVKYNGENKWWVLKGQEGVSLRPFSAEAVKTSYLLDVMNKINELGKEYLPHPDQEDPPAAEDGRPEARHG